MLDPRGPTAAALLAIGALHVAWGRGSTFPFSSREALDDAVVGRTATPPPGAFDAVAGALFVATALVADVPRLPRPVRQIGVSGVGVVLAARAALGFAGCTDVVSPGSVSPRFRRLDRRLLSPLCLALAVGACSSLRR